MIKDTCYKILLTALVPLLISCAGTSYLKIDLVSTRNKLSLGFSLQNRQFKLYRTDLRPADRLESYVSFMVDSSSPTPLTCIWEFDFPINKQYSKLISKSGTFSYDEEGGTISLQGEKWKHRYKVLELKRDSSGIHIKTKLKGSKGIFQFSSVANIARIIRKKEDTIDDLANQKTVQKYIEGIRNGSLTVYCFDANKLRKKLELTKKVEHLIDSIVFDDYDLNSLTKPNKNRMISIAAEYNYRIVNIEIDAMVAAFKAVSSFNEPDILVLKDEDKVLITCDKKEILSNRSYSSRALIDKIAATCCQAGDDLAVGESIVEDMNNINFSNALADIVSICLEMREKIVPIFSEGSSSNDSIVQKTTKTDIGGHKKTYILEGITGIIESTDSVGKQKISIYFVFRDTPEFQWDVLSSEKKLKLYFLNSKVGSSPLSNNFPPPIRSINILPPRMRDDDQNEMPVVVVFDRMPELEIESKYSIINIKYYLNVGDKPLPEGIWK